MLVVETVEVAEVGEGLVAQAGLGGVMAAQEGTRICEIYDLHMLRLAPCTPSP